MAFLKAHQLSFMLFMSGSCGILAIMTLLTRSLSPRRKSILALMETAAMLLLLFDRWCYLYRGDPGDTGYYMVRLGNGMVFFLSLVIPHLVTRYLHDLLENEGGLSRPPRRLQLCEILFVIGTALIIISQFTGLYYSFDAQNTYHRSHGYALSYVIPLLMVLIQESVLLQYRARLSPRLAYFMMLCVALPTLSSIVQLFAYGISLTNITTVFMVIMFYIYALVDLSEAVERARIQELEFYKEAQRREYALFEQTAEALANAIDAKDAYTHGHSARVAMYSRQIAQEAGLSDKDCNLVYFAALLHDVGKIGIPDDIIKKVGALSEEEFNQIKLHPVLGSQILSSIHQSPNLNVGAHYHHERYDGKGYPDGLAGEAIPEIARIIAVADAYDAMTSKRSYRDPIPQQKVRQELAEGMGTQFDPKFAEIMLRLIDSDRDYQMRERLAECISP